MHGGSRRLPTRGHQPRAGGSGLRRVRRPWSLSAARHARGSAAAGVERTTRAEPPDEVLTRPPEFIAPVEIAAGLVWPVVQEYALIENALAAAEHTSSEAQRDEIAALWARFNDVGTRNPDACFGTPRSADDIATPGPAQPSPRLPLQPAALDPVDGRPGLRAAHLLGGSGGRGRGPARAVAVSPRSAALLGGGDAHGAPLPARLARHGRPRPGGRSPPGCAATRPAARRGLLLFPCRRARAAARARTRSVGHAHPDRRHGLRRRTVQPLRAAVSRDPRSAAARGARRISGS